MDEYLKDVNGMQTYFKTRQMFKGRNFSSKFSPYLSSGVLSSRYVYHVVNELQEIED